MQRPWPLHPRPFQHETLELYVRRLAEYYGVRYERFCLLALGIPIADCESRRFRNPTRDVLQRLSVGTTIPVVQLEQMQLPLIWKRLEEEAEQYLMTSEGREWLERMTRHYSQMF